MCRKTGTLPQIWRCRTGTVISEAPFGITISLKINALRDLGAFRVLDPMMHFP